MTKVNDGYGYSNEVIVEMRRRMEGRCFTCGTLLQDGWRADDHEDMCFPCELAREWNIRPAVADYMAQAIRDRLEAMEAPRLPHLPPKKTY